MYDSYKIFTPDNTEDEKPKRKVVFSNTNRFFFVDDDGNQERVDLRANLGDKVIGRCKATVCLAARPDGDYGIASPIPRWLEPTPPRCDDICHMSMYSSTYNASGIRCLYSLRVDHTSQNSYDFIHCLRLLRDLAKYVAIIPNRAFRPKKAHPGTAQYYMESLLEQVDPDEYTPTTESSLYKFERSQTPQLPIQRFLQNSATISVGREGKSFTVAVQARQDKSSRRLSIPRCALPSNFCTPLIGVYSH